ncbi:MAG TPA: NifB/NifX family molybdenum-iron cluster-binding protein [Candidatus Acidoferrales bacterium]|nr:NifB/NifX family molybdenum-iron cluster-binding protein [Candidatus Acidoferrales bacterium]
MKYLIASEGNSIDNKVSGHFGRAPFFLTYDDETKTLAAKANDGSLDPHLVIRDEAKAGMKTMICGGIGPHAYQVAEKFNVKVCIASDISVAEAVKLAGDGRLQVTSGPTAHHHHEQGQHHHGTQG